MDVKYLEEQLAIRRARKDINAFCEYVMRDTTTGERFKQAKIHRDLQNAIDLYDRVLILLPRDCGKTSQMIARVLFELGRNTNHKIKIICSTSSLAKKRILELRTHIEKNEYLKKVFPNLRESYTEDTWSKTSIIVERDIIDKDPSVEGVGILDSAVGGRATMLIFDDVCNYRNTIAYPALKEEVKNAFRNVFLPFLEPGGKVIYIATPWTPDDLTADLRLNPNFFVYEAKVGPNYESPWPERFSPEYFRKLHRDIGDEAFSRSYRLTPIVERDTPFLLAKLEKNFLTATKPDKFDILICACDLGMSEASRTETVIVTVGVNGSRKYLIDVKRGKFSSPDVARLLYDLHQLYKYDAVFVESNAYQIALVEWIRSSGYELPVESINTQIAENYIRLVAYSIEIEMANGLWKMVVDHFDQNCRCDKCRSIKELSEYPQSSHMDFLAAMCIAHKAVQQYIKSASLEVYTPAINRHSRRGYSEFVKGRYLEV